MWVIWVLGRYMAETKLWDALWLESKNGAKSLQVVQRQSLTIDATLSTILRVFSKICTWEMMNIFCAPWQPTVTHCKSPRKMAHWMEYTQSVQTICNEEISSQLGTRLKDSGWSSHCSNTFNQTPPPLMVLNNICWNPCFTRTANSLWNNCWTMTVDEPPPSKKKTLSTSLKRNLIKLKEKTTQNRKQRPLWEKQNVHFRLFGCDDDGHLLPRSTEVGHINSKSWPTTYTPNEPYNSAWTCAWRMRCYQELCWTRCLL